MSSSTVSNSGWVSTADQLAQNSTMQKPSHGLHGSTRSLFLVFMFAILVLLYFYVKYFLTRRYSNRRFLFRTATANQAPRTGLDPSVIAAMATIPYKRNAAAMNSDSKDGSAECAVCLSLLEEEEMVKVLPNCKHVFHVGCIDMWLHTHATCPVCRTDVKAKAPMDVALQPSATIAGGAEGSTSQLSKEDGATSSSSWLSSSFRWMLIGEISGRRVQPDVGVPEELQRV